MTDTTALETTTATVPDTTTQEDVLMDDSSEQQKKVDYEENIISTNISEETDNNNIITNEGNDNDDEDAGEEGEESSSDDDESQSSSSEDEDEEEGDDDDKSTTSNNNNDGLSEYERLRLERIQRNQARLEQLGLLDNKPAKKKPASRKSIPKVEHSGPSRVLPKRERKSILSKEELYGGIDIRKLRLANDASNGKKKKKKGRCGECSGCQREDDCNTCIYCVQRMNGKATTKRCIFRTCLNKYNNKKGGKAKGNKLSSPNTKSTKSKINDDNNDGKEEVTAENNKEEDDTHSDECDICKDGGDLILCSGCDRGFHSNCHFPKIKKLPDDDWLCMECNPRTRFPVAVIDRKVIKVKVLEPPPKCAVCDLDCAVEQESIQCKACDGFFHIFCHDPPMEQKPRGGAARWWKCTGCKEADRPILEHHQQQISSHHGTTKTPKTPKTPRIVKKANLKLFEGEHDDDCYICYNGGELVCCDFCPKVFHRACHIPALPAIPTGIWKCCECYASERNRKTRCGECKACLAEDCGKCKFCLDRPKFGGSNKLKKPCVHRECPYQSFAETFVSGKIPGELGYSSICKTATSSSAKTPKAKPTNKAITSSSKTPKPKPSSSKKKEKKKRKKDPDSNDGEQPKKRVKIEDPAAPVDSEVATSKEVVPSAEKLSTTPDAKDAVEATPQDAKDQAETPQDATKEVVDEQKMEVDNEEGDQAADIPNVEKDEDDDEEPIVVTLKIPKAADAVSAKVRKIVNGANKEPDDSKVQDKACENLRKFTTSPDNVDRIILAGAIEMVSRAMSQHPDKTIVQAEAACTVAEIAWVSPTVGKKLAHVGLIKQIVDCMDRFPCNLKVQQMGCGAFRALSYDDANIQYINDANGLSAVLDSMVRNPKKLVVQKEGCYFLQNLLVQSPDFVAGMIVESQIVPIILEALSNESADTEFKESCLGLVSNLALDEGAKESFGNTNVVSTLVALVQSNMDVNVRQAACYALKHIALDSPKNKTTIFDAGGPSAILGAVTSFLDDHMLCIAAFDLLKELALEDEGVAQGIVDVDGLTIILSAMKKHADLALIQVAACGVTAYLPFGNKGPGDKIAPKIGEAIVSALENHPKVGEVQEAGCEALLEMVTHVPAVQKLAKKMKTRKLLLAAKEAFEGCESDVDDILAF